jgi:cytochrome c biogenesis protein CcmG/thiol:disulfide interchange protein DsbE
MLLSLVCLAAALQAAAADRSLKSWPGGETPELRLQDLDGRARDLARYRGKVVLINFWATWCEPCRDELPSLQRLREALRDRPFEVLAVDVGEGEARIRTFLEKTPVGFPVLLDRDSIAMKAWNVRGLPSSFVVDADGAIRYSFLGELDWAQEHIVATVRSLLPRER